MSKGVLNLSIEESTQITRKFLKQMAQPFSKVSQESNQNFFSTKFQKFLFIQEDQLGVSLLTYEQIKDENNQKKILSRVEINVDM